MARCALRRCARVGFVAVLAMLTLSACQALAGPNHAAVEGSSHVPGFWDGIANGFFVPVEWVIDFVAPGHVSLYQSVNNGIRYETGYLLGLIILAAILWRLALLLRPRWPERWHWHRGHRGPV